MLGYDAYAFAGNITNQTSIKINTDTESDSPANRQSPVFSFFIELTSRIVHSLHHFLHNLKKLYQQKAAMPNHSRSQDLYHFLIGFLIKDLTL
jgi:hypothetical protein